MNPVSRWMLGKLLVRTYRSLTGIRLELGRIADALDARNMHDFPVPIGGSDQVEPTEVKFADSQMDQRLADIELQLTQAKGLPPTEDAVIEEYQRVYGEWPA